MLGAKSFIFRCKVEGLRVIMMHCSNVFLFFLFMFSEGMELAITAKRTVIICSLKVCS